MKVRFAFVCDDVRREENGKLIFLGAYGPNILPTAIPATMVLALVAGMDVSEPSEVDTKFQVMMDGERIIHGGGSLKASLAGFNFFPIKNIPLHMKEPGILDFQLQIADGEWQSVYTVPVEVKPST